MAGTRVHPLDLNTSIRAQAMEEGQAVSEGQTTLSGALRLNFCPFIPSPALSAQGGRININRTRLRIHPGAAVFPAVNGLPLPSFSKAALDSSGSKEPGQSMVIV